MSKEPSYAMEILKNEKFKLTNDCKNKTILISKQQEQLNK
jgi:hypothetical protein